MNIRYKINIYERDVKYKIHPTENKLPKSLLVNNEKKKLKFDHIRTKTSSRRLLRNRRDATEPNGNLSISSVKGRI